MTGLPNFNKEEFEKVEKTLCDLGHSVFNPAWLLPMNENEEFDYDDILAIDMCALTHCNAIYVLKGWGLSAGASAEVEFAKATGMRMYCDDNINELFGGERIK